MIHTLRIDPWIPVRNGHKKNRQYACRFFVNAIFVLISGILTQTSQFLTIYKSV